MADRVLEFVSKERREKREHSHFSRFDISSIIGRKQHGLRALAPTGHSLAAPGGTRRRLRRVGGGNKPSAKQGLGLEEPKEFSEKAGSLGQALGQGCAGVEGPGKAGVRLACGSRLHPLAALLSLFASLPFLTAQFTVRMQSSRCFLSSSWIQAALASPSCCASAPGMTSGATASSRWSPLRTSQTRFSSRWRAWVSVGLPLSSSM